MFANGLNLKERENSAISSWDQRAYKSSMHVSVNERQGEGEEGRMSWEWHLCKVHKPTCSSFGLVCRL
mgnify:CR=1 FL=1